VVIAMVDFVVSSQVGVCHLSLRVVGRPLCQPKERSR